MLRSTTPACQAGRIHGLKAWTKLEPFFLEMVSSDRSPGPARPYHVTSTTHNPNPGARHHPRPPFFFYITTHLYLRSLALWLSGSLALEWPSFSNAMKPSGGQSWFSLHCTGPALCSYPCLPSPAYLAISYNLPPPVLVRLGDCKTGWLPALSGRLDIWVRLMAAIDGRVES
jgi:hypothetical protein